jgi:hypothetical protein
MKSLSLSQGNGFFILKKLFFLMKFIQELKCFKMVFNFSGIYQLHHEKIHPRIPLTTLVLKYICNVFEL